MEFIRSWLIRIKAEQETRIEQIPIKSIENGWFIDPVDGNITHNRSGFFSLSGISVQTNYGFTPKWDQPIIFQPEVGILGLLCKKFNGVLHFLIQAKTEPGNVNLVQLSPTLQATRSNYQQLHQGKKPMFLKYFLSPRKGNIILDQLQSEQCSRFYKKRNRNMIVQVEDDIDVPNNFCWLTFGQIKSLLKEDNLINMDTRSVISCIDYHSNIPNQLSGNRHLNNLLDDREGIYSIDEIIAWVAKMKSTYYLTVDKIPMNSVNQWSVDHWSIEHNEQKYFSIIGLNVFINDREVTHWSQPIIKPWHQGIVGFLTKKMNGVTHYLVQAKVEAGNSDIVELAPTVQCINDDYRNCPPEHTPPYLNYLLELSQNRIKYDTIQSEEGGRFYHEQHRYMIAEVDDNFPSTTPRNYIWMTLSQISLFIRFNNYFNVEARSLVAAIDLEI